MGRKRGYFGTISSVFYILIMTVDANTPVKTHGTKRVHFTIHELYPNLKKNECEKMHSRKYLGCFAQIDVG